MENILSHFYNPFPFFFSGLFWADFLIILLCIFLVYRMISRQSKAILIKNIAYNKGLFAFRAEVYQNFEKNFFV